MPRVDKGHARTSGASMIAGYLGRSDKVDRALLDDAVAESCFVQRSLPSAVLAPQGRRT